MTPPDRKAMESLWRQRLNQAREHLGFARERNKEVHREFLLREIPSPDGEFHRLQAVRAENVALRNYLRVLRVFTDLVTSGKIPDEAKWLRGPGDTESEES